MCRTFAVFIIKLIICARPLHRRIEWGFVIAPQHTSFFFLAIPKSVRFFSKETFDAPSETRSVDLDGGRWLVASCLVANLIFFCLQLLLLNVAVTGKSGDNTETLLHIVAYYCMWWEGSRPSIIPLSNRPLELIIKLADERVAGWNWHIFGFLVNSVTFQDEVWRWCKGQGKFNYTRQLLHCCSDEEMPVQF